MSNQQQHTRPCFAVDIDNVLARAEREVQRWYLELTGKPWPRGQYGSAGGLDTGQVTLDIVEEIFARFHETSIPRLPLLPSAKLALQQLQHKYRIVIITARRPTSRPQTLAWLQSHQIPFEELYHTEDKAGVPEDIRLAVDDHPLHALAYCELGIRVFLMDQPWNRGVTHSLLTRVTGWDELLHVHDNGNVTRQTVTLLESPRVKDLLQSVNHDVTCTAVEAS
ncbi:5' nucleotidase, NT5C type [Nitrospira sp. M1]